MSLVSSKTCLINLVNQNAESSALLNFDSSEWVDKINAAASLQQIYSILTELNAVSASLVDLIPGTIGCDSAATPEIGNYLDNAQSFLSQDVPGSIGLLSSLTTTDKTSIVNAINSLNAAISITSYANTIGMCTTSLQLRALSGSPLGSTYALQSALSADLGNIFIISSTINPTSQGATCLARLQCVMKPGISSYCPMDSKTHVQNDPACSIYTLSNNCDHTWFCNLNRLRLSSSGTLGDEKDDGDMFGVLAASEIC